MGLEFEVALNIIIVLAIIFCFNILCLVLIRNIRINAGKEVLYDRSEHLLIFANIVNLIESLANILYQLKIYLDGYSSMSDMAFYIVAFYFTRYYASCMGLRLYRIKKLYDIRAGNCRSNAITQNSFGFSFVVANSYSVVTTGIYIVMFFFEKPPEVYLRGIYMFESCLLFVGSYLLFNCAKHPSIIIEYIYTSAIWLTGCTELTETRRLLIIPIRNSLLMLVSLLSIYSHSNLIRPCLPIEMTLTDIFEIKEVFLDFQMFLESRLSEMELERFMFYTKLKFLPQALSQKNLADMASRLKSTDFENTGFLTINSVQDSLESSLQSMVECYLQSPAYEAMRKEYFINFN